MSKIKSNYTGLYNSEKTVSYYNQAAIHFQNVNKAATDCSAHATAAVKHAVNIVENGVHAAGYIQGLVSDAVNSDYSVVATFAQAMVTGVAALAYYNPPIIMGVLGVGAVLVSPADTIGCVKNTVEAGLTATHVAYETIMGLKCGAEAIVSEIIDNVYSHDNIDLAGSILMIEY